MIKGTVNREVRFKSGHQIRKGEAVILNWPDPRENPAEVELLHQDRSLRVSAVSALAWIGLVCTDDELEDAVLDGVCETPNGTRVEPDGVDSDGVPSWALIHGIY